MDRLPKNIVILPKKKEKKITHVQCIDNTFHNVQYIPRLSHTAAIPAKKYFFTKQKTYTCAVNSLNTVRILYNKITVF